MAGSGWESRAGTSLHGKVSRLYWHIDKQSAADTDVKGRGVDDSLRSGTAGASEGGEASAIGGCVYRRSDVVAERSLPVAVESEVWWAFYGADSRNCDTVCDNYAFGLLLGGKQAARAGSGAAYTVSLWTFLCYAWFFLFNPPSHIFADFFAFFPIFAYFFPFFFYIFAYFLPFLPISPNFPNFF